MTRLKRDDPATLNSSLSSFHTRSLRKLGMVLAGVATLAGLGMAYGKLSGSTASLGDATIKPAQAKTPRKAANCVPRAKAAGARIVIVNGGPTEMDSIADEFVTGDINTVLPRLCGIVPER